MFQLGRVRELEVTICDFKLGWGARALPYAFTEERYRPNSWPHPPGRQSPKLVSKSKRIPYRIESIENDNSRFIIHNSSFILSPHALRSHPRAPTPPKRRLAQ